jgi:hypothetical protein
MPRNRQRTPGAKRLLLVVIPFLSACTVYEPVRSPRVAVVKNAFRRGLVRDGTYYGGGAFGGNVDEAVSGVPEAISHARSYQTLSIIGSVALFTGEAAAISGSLIVPHAIDDPETKSDARVAFIVSSLTLLVTGVVLHMAAEPHLYDAANLYNERVDAGWRPMQPGAPPAERPPRGSPEESSRHGR